MKKTSPLEIYSVFALVQSIVVRTLLVGTIIYCGISFKENPIVIGVLLVFFVLLLLASGMDVVRIYPDRFEHVSTAILPLFCKTKTFYYARICHVEAEGPASLMEQLLTGTLKWNHLRITTADEEVFTITSYLYMESLTRAVKIINEKIKS